MKGNLVGALFFPGSFYDDIKGRVFESGITIGTNVAFLITAGMEYKF
jgi:hypothetical protein